MPREKRYDRIMVEIPLTRQVCLRLDDVRRFVQETAHIPGDRKVLNVQHAISIDLEEGE